jgi:hypothetical protein
VSVDALTSRFQSGGKGDSSGPWSAGSTDRRLVVFPRLEGQEQHRLTLNDYGLGVDCHSGFFQICVLVSTGKSLVTYEFTVRAVWPELMKAKQTVLSTLALRCEAPDFGLRSKC